MLIIHGDADPFVPHHQSMRLARGLKKAGADAEMKTIAGAGPFLGITGSVQVQNAIREARDHEVRQQIVRNCRAFFALLSDRQVNEREMTNADIH